MNARPNSSLLCLRWLMMTLGLVMLLVSPCVAHHHHGARLCQTMERCERDHAVNDRHTAHHEQPQDEAGCVKKQGAIVTSQTQVKAAVAHALPLALLGTAATLPVPHEVRLMMTRQGVWSPATASVIAEAYGRRGPPDE